MPHAISATGQRKKRRTPVGFILACTAPAFLLTAYFTVWPTIQAIYLSFTDATILGAANAKIVGLDNYKYMFGDKNFVQALSNTLRLMLVVPIITLAISLIIAFALSQSKLRERGFYRTAIFFPSVVSMTVVGIIWSFVFHPTMGILNTLLKTLGAEKVPAWVGDSKTALWTIAAALVWQAAGYFMVMHLAAMDGISSEIYEAATIDGAGPVRKLFFITLPLILDILGITFVFALSGTLNNSFVLAQVMTNGGPNGASTVILQYMYKQGMRNGNFGYAMSITVFALAMAVVLSMFSRKLTERREG